MKKALVLTLAALTALTLSACSAGTVQTTEKERAESQQEQNAQSEDKKPETITAMLGHVSAEESSYQYGCQRFAELVYERTDGGLQIEIYPNGQLGSDNDMFESLQNNTIQFAGIGIDMLSNYIPELKTLELPFLFEDVDSAVKVYESDVVLSYINQINEWNVEYLGMMNAGFRQLETVDTEVNSITDIKGLKLRVPSGVMFENIWNAVGTAPTPTNYNETYMALQTGVVEGVELPLDVFLSSGFPDICKNVAYINYRIQAPAIFVSSEFLDSLPQEYQAIVMEAAKDACKDEMKWFAEQEEDIRRKCEEEFGCVFTNPDLEEFRAACEPLYSACEYPEFLKQVLEVMEK